MQLSEEAESAKSNGNHSARGLKYMTQDTIPDSTKNKVGKKLVHRQNREGKQIQKMLCKRHVKTRQLKNNKTGTLEKAVTLITRNEDELAQRKGSTETKYEERRDK